MPALPTTKSAFNSMVRACHTSDIDKMLPAIAKWSVLEYKDSPASKRDMLMLLRDTTKLMVERARDNPSVDKDKLEEQMNTFARMMSSDDEEESTD